MKKTLPFFLLLTMWVQIAFAQFPTVSLDLQSGTFASRKSLPAGTFFNIKAKPVMGSTQMAMDLYQFGQLNKAAPIFGSAVKLSSGTFNLPVAQKLEPSARYDFRFRFFGPMDDATRQKLTEDHRKQTYAYLQGQALMGMKKDLTAPLPSPAAQRKELNKVLTDLLNQKTGAERTKWKGYSATLKEKFRQLNFLIRTYQENSGNGGLFKDLRDESREAIMNHLEDMTLIAQGEAARVLNENLLTLKKEITITGYLTSGLTNESTRGGTVIAGATIPQPKSPERVKKSKTKAPKTPKTPKVKPPKTPKTPKLKVPKAPKVKSPRNKTNKPPKTLKEPKEPKTRKVKTPKAPKIPKIKIPKTPKTPKTNAPKPPKTPKAPKTKAPQPSVKQKKEKIPEVRRIETKPSLADDEDPSEQQLLDTGARDKYSRVISLNVGYGLTYLNDFSQSLKNLSIGPAPFVGISLPFGRPGVKYNLASRLSFSAGFFLTPVMNESDQEFSGPLNLKLPAYTALGIHMLQVLRLHLGVTYMNTPEIGEIESQFVVRPWVGLAIDLNMRLFKKFKP